MFLNGSDRPLNESNLGLPNLSSALDSWLQKMTFAIVTKETINYKTVETKEEIEFMGVWQPMGGNRINYKPEGQRAWAWFTVHSKTSLKLKHDDVIIYRGRQYRVGTIGEYNEYGYYSYDIADDFTGSGPYKG